jgi:hypothetical protein
MGSATILAHVSLLTLIDTTPLSAPSMLVAFDAWVDAGSASTTAAGLLGTGGDVIGRLDADRLFDYRARRPTLEIVDGQPSELTWPELEIRRRRYGGRDLLVLSGPEPDFRWQQLGRELIDMARQIGVVEWLSIGAIPAAVPHTRPVPILGTASRPGLLRGDVQPGPAGVLRVPSAAISTLDMAAARAGIPAIGYYAQVPHYVSGPYPAAAVALLHAVSHHIDAEIVLGDLAEEAIELRTKLDTAAAMDDATRAYVDRLESMVDEARLPSGDELIGEIERFLRESGNEGSQRQ